MAWRWEHGPEPHYLASNPSSSSCAGQRAWPFYASVFPFCKMEFMYYGGSAAGRRLIALKCIRTRVEGQ